MKINTLLALGALAAATIATPIEAVNAVADVAQEASASISAGDYSILTFALTLEHLEAAFYNDALKRLKASDFEDEALYEDLRRLVRNEETHVQKISEVFRAGRRAVPQPCKYTFPFNSSSEFLKLASVIEGVGVSAYAGASPAVRSKNVLKMAAAILPVEARHDAILRLAVDAPPYAGAFDVPLSFQQAWSLASGFIVKDSCPKEVLGLGLKSVPALTLVQNATQTTVTTNSTITMKADIPALQSTQTSGTKHKRHNIFHRKREENADRVRAMYVAFLTADGSTNVEAKLGNGVVTAQVPDGVYGQTYVVLTTSKTGVTDRLTLAGPAIIEIADNVATGSAGSDVDDIVPVNGTGTDDNGVSGGVSISAGIGGGVGLSLDAASS